MLLLCSSVVEELFMRSEVYDASRDGAHGSDNVGMSNHKSDEISDHRKFKVSLAMTISQGLGGPYRAHNLRCFSTIGASANCVLGMDSRLIFRPSA